MRDGIQLFFELVGYFYVAYMIGYASFLFLAVTVGSSTLYQVKRRNRLKNAPSRYLRACYHCGARPQRGGHH